MSGQFPFLLLPQVVWDNLTNYVDDDDLLNLYYVHPQLKQLVKKIDDIIMRKVLNMLVSKSYLDRDDLLNCYSASDAFARSVLSSWCHQISQRDFTWDNPEFPERQKLETVDEIMEFLEKVEKLEGIEKFLFFVQIGFQFSFHLPTPILRSSYVEEYRNCMDTFFKRFGQFCVRVQFLDFDNIETIGTLKAELLGKLKNLHKLTFFMRSRTLQREWTSRAKPTAQIHLTREINERSLEPFYSLKASHGFPLHLYFPSVPASITKKIKMLEIDSTVDGVATAAQHLRNLEELKLKIVRDGWKKLFDAIEELPDFFGKIPKLTLIFLGPCLLINNLCRLSSYFQNTTELHLEIHDGNNQLINADETRWPPSIFKNVRKFCLRLGENLFDAEIRRMNHLPPLTFLKLFPVMKTFHFISVLPNGVNLGLLIKDLKLMGILRDEVGFYEALQNGLVGDSKLWQLLPQLETIRVTIHSVLITARQKTFTEYRRG